MNEGQMQALVTAATTLPTHDLPQVTNYDPLAEARGQRDEARRERDELQARCDRLRAILRDVLAPNEPPATSAGLCPWCGGYVASGDHDDNCVMVRARLLLRFVEVEP